MKAKELVGKIAIRTGGNRMGDWSYTETPLRIMKATEHHIYVAASNYGEYREMLLDERFIDGKWTSFKDVVPNMYDESIVEKFNLDLLGITPDPKDSSSLKPQCEGHSVTIEETYA